jgi:hypothetical protein
MASGLTGEHPISRMQATVLRMQRERARDSVTRRVRERPKPGDAGKRRRHFDDVAVVVWVVALIGIVVLCGAVMVLSLISATVSMSTRIAGPESDSGAVTGSQSGAALVDDDWVYGPKLTR